MNRQTILMNVKMDKLMIKLTRSVHSDLSYAYYQFYLGHLGEDCS